MSNVVLSAVLAATPILLAALGGLYTYHVDVFNIAMEGMMLIGAFCAVLGSFLHASWVFGLLYGIAGGMVAALLFALFAVYLGTDEFITAIAINMLSLGGTTYALRQLFDVKGAFVDPAIVGLPRWTIPFLGEVPFLVPLSFVLVGVVSVHLYRLPFGLRLRATGQDSRAVDSVGVNTRRLKSTAIVLSGVFCGLAGVFLSLGYVRLFAENMSNGRGWISLAVIILTRGRPVSVLLMALLFGFFDGVGLGLQSRNVPSQFTQMVPYLVTLVALYLYSRDTRRAH